MTNPQPFVTELSEEMRQRFGLRRIIAHALIRAMPDVAPAFRHKLVSELSEGLFARDVRLTNP